MEDDDNDLVDGIEDIQINESIRPAQGSPFSALIPSMWPQDILAKLGQPEVSFSFKQFSEIRSKKYRYFRQMEPTIHQITVLMNLDFVLKKKMDLNKVQINCSVSRS